METIINRLMGMAEEIAILYQKWFSKDLSDEMSNEALMHLNIAKEAEQRIYNSIPVTQYNQYINTLSLEDSANANLISIMLENYYFEPKIRVINQFLYLQQKRVMFNDGEKQNIYNAQMVSDLRFSYLYHYELFLNLSRFYQIYITSQEDIAELLTPSYVNVLYSFPNAEYFFKKDIFKVYDKKSLQRLSNIPNIETRMDDEYRKNIIGFYEEFMKSDVSMLFASEIKVTKSLMAILLSTFYFSIDSSEMVVDLLNKYRARLYPDLSPQHQEFLEELFITNFKNFTLRRKFKQQEEAISLKQL